VKTTIPYCLLFVVLLINARSAFSQNAASHEHATTAPHNGLVKQADDYHIEMVRTNEQQGKASVAVYTFYLLDSAMNTLPNTGKTGVVFIQTSEGISTQEKTNSEGNEKLVCKLQLNGVATLLIVTIKDNEKEYTATYKQNASPMGK
jgi:hypothetical protein